MLHMFLCSCKRNINALLSAGRVELRLSKNVAALIAVRMAVRYWSEACAEAASSAQLERRIKTRSEKIGKRSEKDLNEMRTR